MQNIIVDANILFSGILNVNGKIGNLLLTSRRYFRFFATEFLRHEIEAHRRKIAEASGLPDEEIEMLVEKLFQRITFIPEDTIPFECWHRSAGLVRDIDPDDISYVALTEHIGGKLWTGDTKLRKGLTSKGYTNCISTKELSEWRSLLRLTEKK